MFSIRAIRGRHDPPDFRSVQPVRRRPGRGLELVLPAEDLGLGTVFLGRGLVAFFHPDAGERRVDEQVLRLEGMGTLGGGQGFVIASEGEQDLAQGVSGLERTRNRLGGMRELGQGGLGLPHGVVEGRIIDEGLQDLGRHKSAERSALPTKRKDGLAGRPFGTKKVRGKDQAFGARPARASVSLISAPTVSPR